MKLYTAEQIKTLDKIAIANQFSNNGFILMERAGKAAFLQIEKLYVENKSLVIFCGQGNNGGDGFVLAALAAQAGYYVIVVFLGVVEKLSSDAKKAYYKFHLLVDGKERFLHQLSSDFNENFTDYINTQNKKTVFVDALLGIGLAKPIEGVYKSAIEFINRQQNIIAIDIPSGLHADTGVAYQPVVKANYTLSFIGLKQGFFTNNGPDNTGHVILDSLGVEQEVYSQVENSSWLMTQNWANDIVKNKLQKRPKNCHKHQFGHIVMIGGDNSMPGAVVMSGTAALRGGAGLVSIITHDIHSAAISQQQLELMVYGVSNNIAEHKLKILELLTKANVVVLGPGLGQTNWSQQLFDFVLNYLINNIDSNQTVVIDADGLNLLSEYIIINENRDNFNKIAHKIVLTPHPGEASKLIHNNINISDDRFAAVTILSDSYGAAVILKGVGTLVKDLDQKIAVCQAGNSGMASAGMGDILTGIVAALLANKLDRYTASCLAVYVHATAADKQAKKFGERGLLATDLLLEIRRLINSNE